MIYADTTFMVAYRVQSQPFYTIDGQLNAARFVSFDEDQLALAEAAGLETLRPS